MKKVAKELQRGEQVNLPFGAIITELRKPSSSLGKYNILYDNKKAELRWAMCRLANECVDCATQRGWWGFSCENCPNKGKVEFMEDMSAYIIEEGEAEITLADVLEEILL